MRTLSVMDVLRLTEVGGWAGVGGRGSCAGGTAANRGGGKGEGWAGERRGRSGGNNIMPSPHALGHLSSPVTASSVTSGLPPHFPFLPAACSLSPPSHFPSHFPPNLSLVSSACSLRPPLRPSFSDPSPASAPPSRPQQAHSPPPLAHSEPRPSGGTYWHRPWGVVLGLLRCPAPLPSPHKGSSYCLTASARRACRRVARRRHQRGSTS